MIFEPHLEHFQDGRFPPPRPPRRMGPWRVDPEFWDESFTSIIKFIVLVETVPKLAVEEASFLSVASSCGPPPSTAHF